MPLTLITAQTAAAESIVFKVDPGSAPVGISAWGLSGSEEMQIQRDRGDGTFRDLEEDSAVLTVAQPDTSITASGTYKITKPETDNPAGASRN